MLLHTHTVRMFVPRLLAFNSIELFCLLKFLALRGRWCSPQQVVREKSQKDDSVKETLIGQMTAINCENSCLMTEHMKSIYQNDNAVQIAHIRRQCPICI